MSDFVAIWHRAGQQVNQDTIDKTLATEINPKNNGKDTWLKDSVALGHRHFWITPEEVGERQPLVDANSGCVIAADVRLDNRAELLHLLGMDEHASDAQLLLGAYLRWGEDCPAQLLGDFAFIVWDPKRQQLFAARDALGAVELVYLLRKDSVILAGCINSLLAYPGIHPELDDKTVFKYLALNRADEESTYYENIYHVPPAHWLLVTKDGIRLQRYWEVETGNKIRYKDQNDYAQHFRELINAAIRARSRSIHPIGVSLSGGLDSSTLTCLLAEMMPIQGLPQTELGTYSYVFDEFLECDERDYIQAVIDASSKKFSVRETHVLGDKFFPMPLAANWPVNRDCPDQDPYVLLVQALLSQAACDGIGVMFNGLGGDDLYSGDELLFADLLAEGRVKDSVKILSRASAGINTLLAYSLRALVPSRLKKWYRAAFPAASWKGWMGAGFASKVGLENLDNSMHAYPKFKVPGVQHRYYNLFFSGYSKDVRAYQRLAGQFGLKYAFPFYDRSIIEFVLAIPSDQVNGLACQRKLLRNAMQGRLPEVVRNRSDKTMLLQLYDQGIYAASWQTITNSLQKAQVIQRGWVDQNWLRTEMQGSGRTHEGYILWLVICLELWLQHYWA